MEVYIFAFLSIWALINSVSAVELTFELEDNAKECFFETISKGKQTELEYQFLKLEERGLNLDSIHVRNFEPRLEEARFRKDLGTVALHWSNLETKCKISNLAKNFASSSFQCIQTLVVTGGQYDVDVKILDPSNRILYDEKKQQYGQFEFEAQVDGDYQICFSNEFSTFSHKLVYFDFQAGEEESLPGLGGEHHKVMTQMETSSQKIHEDLNSMIDYQTHHRLREAQGRKRAEELNEKVLLWAFGETLGILIVTIGQVMILKNFFADRK